MTDLPHDRVGAPSGAAGAPGAGADLARIALHQARAAAKACGQATRATKPKGAPA